MGEDFTWPSWDDLLLNEGRRNGWSVPASSWWQRLPIVRHVRCIVIVRSNPHIPHAYDHWLANMIWRGWC